MSTTARKTTTSKTTAAKTPAASPPGAPDDSPLTIPVERVYEILVRARQFDAKDVVTDPDDSSNASDDGMREVLEDHPDDPVRAEIIGMINDLNVDEQIDLVTLAWLGRGDGDASDWDELRAEAARAHNKRTASYLLGMPLLASYLEEGLDMLGYSISDEEEERL